MRPVPIRSRLKGQTFQGSMRDWGQGLWEGLDTMLTPLLNLEWYPCSMAITLVYDSFSPSTKPLEPSNTGIMKYYSRQHEAPAYSRDNWDHGRRRFDNYDDYAASNDLDSPSSRRRRGSHTSDTYGTYIYEISRDDHRYYHARDPTRCNCRCCPHPRMRADSAFSAGGPEDWPRRGSGLRFGGHYPSGSSSYARTSHRPGYDTDYSRDHHRNAHSHETSHIEASNTAFRPKYQSRTSSRPAKKALHHVDRDIVINVVDRTARQHLRAQYGRHFPLAISPHTMNARDICLFLAPDQRRERVVVRWRGGELEPLDDLVPIHDLGLEGTRLEVRTRKHVRWM